MCWASWHIPSCPETHLMPTFQRGLDLSLAVPQLLKICPDCCSEPQAAAFTRNVPESIQYPVTE